MRKKAFSLVAALLIVLVAVTALGARQSRQADLQTARAEVSVLPQTGVPVRPADSLSPVQDYRDSAALVLVGSMLIGLAAAVRRTA